MKNEALIKLGEHQTRLDSPRFLGCSATLLKGAVIIESSAQKQSHSTKAATLADKRERILGTLSLGNPVK